MASAPAPSEIFESAVSEGRRRLEQPMLELVGTAFVAGITVVLGIVGLAAAHGAVQPYAAGLAPLAGGLVFGVGLVFLIIGRTELFTENIFDPTAVLAKRFERRIVARIARLWLVTFLVNLLAGMGFVLLLSVPGVLSADSAHALRSIASGVAEQHPTAVFITAIAGGALVTLLSFLVRATDSTMSRVALAYLAGVLLVIGPFEHAVLTALQLFFGLLLGAAVDAGEIASTVALITLGNLVGGLGLMTLSHIAQAKGAEEQ